MLAAYNFLIFWLSYDKDELIIFDDMTQKGHTNKGI